jgi:nucleotide-binding universal stress UspA family protein
MNLDAVPPGSIVVGIDGSEQSEQAVLWAAGEASRRALPLHVVHALETDPVTPSFEPADADTRRAAQDDVVTSALERARRSRPDVRTSAQTTLWLAASALVAASDRADSVVVGSRGLGAARTAVLGSVSQQVAGYARSPVVVVREVPSEDGEGAGRVVVGVDGSEASSEATGYAFARAASLGMPLNVVHAWWWKGLHRLLDESPWAGDPEKQNEQGRELVAKAVSGWEGTFPGVEVHPHVVKGHPVDALVEESAGAHLLVVGSRGRGGFAGLTLGSVSQGVLHHARCPVAVIRHREDTRDG